MEHILVWIINIINVRLLFIILNYFLLQRSYSNPKIIDVVLQKFLTLVKTFLFFFLGFYRKMSNGIAGNESLMSCLLLSSSSSASSVEAVRISPLIHILVSHWTESHKNEGNTVLPLWFFNSYTARPLLLLPIDDLVKSSEWYPDLVMYNIVLPEISGIKFMNLMIQ